LKLGIYYFRKSVSRFSEKILNSKLVLASASPRRRQLLTEARYEFTIVEPDVDESAFPTDGVDAGDYARRLALAKANSIASKYPDSIVIGADTVADFQGQIIGKPADAGDAETPRRSPPSYSAGRTRSLPVSQSSVNEMTLNLSRATPLPFIPGR